MKREALLGFLAGALLYLPFSKLNLWFFLFPALYLFLKNPSLTLWSVGGYTFFFLSLRCVNIASVEFGGVNPILAYFIFSLFALFLTLYQFVVPLILWRRFFRKNPWLLPLVYVCFELLRSYFPYGGFPWLVIGSVVGELPLLNQSFYYLNVYIQSLVALYSVLFFAEKRFKNLALLLLFLLFVSLLSFYEKRERVKKAPTLKVALVQTAVPQQDKLDPQAFKKHTHSILDLVEEASLKGVELVVLPESALAFYYSQDYEEGYDRLMLLSFRVPILVGLVDIREGLKPYNSAYLIKDGRAVGYYDKVRLLPVGEYLPYPFGFLKEVFGAIGGIDYVHGQSLEPLRYKGLKIATPICFEVAYWDLVRELSKGANLVVVLTNDGWFKDSDCAFQHRRWAKVRALE
ncbi:MAG: apolipoprotein N-acyltransferase, partial [Aquificota bacterium]